MSCEHVIFVFLELGVSCLKERLYNCYSIYSWVIIHVFVELFKSQDHMLPCRYHNIQPCSVNIFEPLNHSGVLSESINLTAVRHYNLLIPIQYIIQHNRDVDKGIFEPLTLTWVLLVVCWSWTKKNLTSLSSQLRIQVRKHFPPYLWVVLYSKNVHYAQVFFTVKGVMSFRGTWKCGLSSK